VPDLLSRLEMSLAFSTCQAGKLFIVGHDTITDFGSGDVIDLSGMDADGDFGAKVSGDGWDVVLNNATAADLTSTDCTQNRASILVRLPA